MVIVCSSCGAKYKFDETRLGLTPSKKIKCPKCKGIIEIINQHYTTAAEPVLQGPAPAGSSMDRTYTSAPKPGHPNVSDTMDTSLDEQPRTNQVKQEDLTNEYLKLPDNAKISLAVIQGTNSGEIYQVSKPRMIIGRSNADITIKDPEASRAHAELAIMGERIVLRDLNSTNGTYVEEERVSVSNLENRSEFRIGTTVFMVIITDLE